jgi:hypothetical protein
MERYAVLSPPRRLGSPERRETLFRRSFRLVTDSGLYRFQFPLLFHGFRDILVEPR